MARLVPDIALMYLQSKTTSGISLSSIVTYNGKIGPAYSDYEEYANACLNCADVGQF